MNIDVSLEGVDVSLSDIKISYATAAIDDLDIPAGMQIGATVGFLDMDAETLFQLSSNSADMDIKFGGEAFKKVFISASKSDEVHSLQRRSLLASIHGNVVKEGMYVP